MAKADGFVTVARKALAEGHRIVRRARRDMTWRGESVGLEHAETLGGMVRPPPSMRGAHLDAIITALMRRRRPAAGAAVIALRQTFPRDSDWQAYVAHELPKIFAERRLAPLTLQGIEQLIGEVGVRHGAANCVKCSAMLVVPCSCGMPYLPQMPWIDEPEAILVDAPMRASPAEERAMAAILASPDKANALIAKEIGVGEATVRRARKKLAARDEVHDEVARVGADGKVRHLPRAARKLKQADPDSMDDAANQQIRKLLRPTTDFINEIADIDLRKEFTAEGRDAIAQAVWSVMDALGSVAQEINDVNLEDQMKGGPSG